MRSPDPRRLEPRCTDPAQDAIPTNPTESDPPVVRALLVPADPRRPVEVRDVDLLSSALSDTIGGGLLDDALHATHAGTHYVIYLDEERLERGLPRNDRAAALAARLGVAEPHWIADLRGDALVIGNDRFHNDEPLPDTVLDAARAAKILPAIEPPNLTPDPR